MGLNNLNKNINLNNLINLKFFDKNYDNKKIKIILKLFLKIFGINIKSVLYICSSFGISFNFFLVLINNNIQYFEKFVLKNFLINRSLRKQIIQNIEKKKKLNMYQGIRFFQKLPVRGQRTKTNAQTAKRLNILK